jgi:sugar phosphate permease
MQSKEKQVWFPAKEYGWGWGLPCVWQGCVALAIWLTLICVEAVLLIPSGHFGLWIASVVVLVIAIFVLCFVKGERPRWRWGKD